MIGLSRGIARAWTAYREATRKSREVMIALSDSVHGDGSDASTWTIFWSLEAALKDRLDDELDVAVVRPCRTAFPTGAHTSITGFLLGHVNANVSAWADFHMTSEDAIYITTADIHDRLALKRDLANRLAAAMRGWAEAHGCHDRLRGSVEVNAWNFTGPEQRYTHDGKKWTLTKP